jgi:hypothetical protein
MIAFVMIVRDVLGHGLPEVPLAERNDAIETFLPPIRVASSVSGSGSSYL